jgi:hypothetical protein
MIISRQASRLAGHSGAVAPDAGRHQLFTAGGQAPGAGGAPPVRGARGRASGGVPLRCHASHGWQPDSRREPASMGGTAR